MGAAGGLWRGPGGIAMSATSLNLLRFPRRPQMHVGRWLWWGLAGLCIGVLMGSGWGVWSQHALPFWRGEQQRLQAELAQQSRAQAARAAKTQLARAERQEQARLQDWQLRREQLLRWHGLFTQLAAEQGWVVQRWQGDERRMVLQGWLPEPQAWPLVQSKLAAAGSPSWTLQSLSAGPSAGVQLVLEAPWAATSTTAQEKRP